MKIWVGAKQTQSKQAGSEGQKEPLKFYESTIEVTGELWTGQQLTLH